MKIYFTLRRKCERTFFRFVLEAEILFILSKSLEKNVPLHLFIALHYHYKNRTRNRGALRGEQMIAVRFASTRLLDGVIYFHASYDVHNFLQVSAANVITTRIASRTPFVAIIYCAFARRTIGRCPMTTGTVEVGDKDEL